MLEYQATSAYQDTTNIGLTELMDDGDNYSKNIYYYFLKQTNIYAAGPGLLCLHPKEGLVFLFN